MVQSPFNYAGNKFELLPELQKLFPSVINIFGEPFVGSGSVFANIPAKKYIVNDRIGPLIYFMWVLWKQANQDYPDVTITLEKLRDQKGLTKQNANFKDVYQEYREQVNTILKSNADSDTKGILFYLLLCCCHNNLIRFNKSMEFNQTFGDRTFNDSMKKKLLGYVTALKNKDVTFMVAEFEDVARYYLTRDDKSPDDFFYFDPPYLISEAGYNIMWSEEKEKKLYTLLDEMDAREIKWGLSNISIHKGQENKFLTEWMKDYTVTELKKDYLKVAKKKADDTIEVFVCNY